MLCYKDMSFCNATDCANKECPRNTRGPNYTPDDWWKDRVAIMNFKDSCKDYTKDEEIQSV